MILDLFSIFIYCTAMAPNENFFEKTQRKFDEEQSFTELQTGYLA